jgi:hypothetical protein
MERLGAVPGLYDLCWGRAKLFCEGRREVFRGNSDLGYLVVLEALEGSGD